MGNQNRTNFILLERASYGRPLAELLAEVFPNTNCLFPGGEYDEASRFLRQYTPSTKEKHMVITAGTINGKTDFPGSAYLLVNEWLQYMSGLLQRTENREWVAANFGILTNPSFPERRELDFEPFRRLYDTCNFLHVPLLIHDKVSGHEGMIKKIGDWLKEGRGNVEGNTIKAMRK